MSNDTMFAMLYANQFLSLLIRAFNIGSRSSPEH